MNIDTTIATGKRQGTRDKILGMIILIFGLALVTWYIFDTIMVYNNYRLVYIDDIGSIVRLVIGTIGMFTGILVWKWEDIGTVTP
jgi:hypothetical protein